MFPSSGYFRSITCPYFASGLCERPHCHFRHVKSDPVYVPTPAVRPSLDNVPSPSGDPRPDLLRLVREAVLQIQKEVEDDRSKLKETSSVTAVNAILQESATNASAVAAKELITRKQAPAAAARKTGHVLPVVPVYKPTPIVQLKKRQEKQGQAPAAGTDDLEYDPTANCSTSSSKTIESSVDYKPSPKVPYVPPVSKTKHAAILKVKYVPNAVSAIRQENADPGVSSDDDDDDGGGGDSFEKAVAFSDDDDDGNEHKKKITKDSATTANDDGASSNFDIVNMILTESTTCDKLMSAASLRKESRKSESKPSSLVKNKKTLVQTAEPKPVAGSLTTKKIIDKPSSSSSTKNNSKSKSIKNKSSGTSDSNNKTSSKKPQDSSKLDSQKSEKINSSSSKKKADGSKSQQKEKKGKHNESGKSTNTKSKHKESKKDDGSSLSDGKPKQKSAKKWDKKEDGQKNASSSSHKKSHTKDKRVSKSLIGKNENGKIRAADNAADPVPVSDYKALIDAAKAAEVPDDMTVDSDLDEHDTYEECLKIFNEYVPEPQMSAEERTHKQKKAMALVDRKQEQEAEAACPAGKKRVAHDPGGMEIKRPKTIANHTPSPSQMMHQRMLQYQMSIQKAAPPPPPRPPPPSLSTMKKRIAHVPNAAPGPKALGVAPNLQHSTNSVVAHSSAEAAATQSVTGQTVAKGAKRVAHAPTQVTSKRPTVPVEFGSRVPIGVRQRYLNVLIDDCLKIYDTEQDAFDRALSEEKNSYERSVNRNVYANIVANAIKRLRDERKDSNYVAQPTRQPEIRVQPNSQKSANMSRVSRVPTANTGRNSAMTRRPSVSSPPPRTVSHEFVLGGKKAANTSYSIERLNRSRTAADQRLSTARFYQALQAYLMPSTQLVENGYPVIHPDGGSRVMIKQNSKTHLKFSDPMDKICDRCGKGFKVSPKGIYLSEEECFYHWGRPWKTRSGGALETRYSCCQGGLHSEGCSIAKLHVYISSDTCHLKGFVKTMPRSPVWDGNYGVYALDCEMSYTTMGSELTRVTVVDSDLKSVYESLVKPENPIVDYNTRFSGIAEGDLDHVRTTLRDVQAVLLSMFNSSTILIGHSLESDFKALQLVHETVVDTSMVFPHRQGPPFKRALRNLSAEYLKKIIQNGVDGHDSQEDAKACMELMLWKVKEDLKKGY